MIHFSGQDMTTPNAANFIAFCVARNAYTIDKPFQHQ